MEAFCKDLAEIQQKMLEITLQMQENLDKKIKIIMDLQEIGLQEGTEKEKMIQ